MFWRITIAAAMSVGLMIGAMWTWQQGPHWAVEADSPELVIWAARSAAVAVAALAQTLALSLVVGSLFRVRGADVVLRLLATAVFSVAAIGAVVLGLASR